jgi:methionyl-tRNA synthetase
MKKKIFIGVAWPYVNGDLHVGHLAGYLLPADITARFHRYLGDDVLMVSGSDCFGTPITVEAEKRGVKPEKLIEEYYPKHLSLFETTKISFDIFTKTTTNNHQEIAQNFFLSFYEKGYIFRKEVDQYYDPEKKKFLPDRYVEGECPYCGFKEAKSDQCDNCGQVLDQGELKNPHNKLTGKEVKLKKSEHYFFDLKKLEPFINEYFKKSSGNWKNWVREETRGWLERGLNARAFTRDLEWGIPLPVNKIPEEERIENIENKRIYVWWEAVMGYFTASVEWAKKENKDWKEFWENEDALHYYFMGKDNLPFHTMFWPGELHLYNEKLHLPDKPVINQYLNFGKEQFSKSRGVIVNSKYVVEEYGLDPVRLYLTLIMPENADTEFTWTDFVERHNSVTIGNLGNFINRTLKMAKDLSIKPEFLEEEVIKEAEKKIIEARTLLSSPEYKNYVQSILSLSDFGNKYLSEREPWKIEEEKEKARIISNAVFMVLVIQALAKPLLVESVEKLENILNVSFEKWPENIEVIKEKFNEISINKPEPLFNKIDKDIIEKETEKAGLI